MAAQAMDGSFERDPGPVAWSKEDHGDRVPGQRRSRVEAALQLGGDLQKIEQLLAAEIGYR
jgi:hypothetical protein